MRRRGGKGATKVCSCKRRTENAKSLLTILVVRLRRRCVDQGRRHTVLHEQLVVPRVAIAIGLDVAEDVAHLVVDVDLLLLRLLHRGPRRVAEAVDVPELLRPGLPEFAAHHPLVLVRGSLALLVRLHRVPVRVLDLPARASEELLLRQALLARLEDLLLTLQDALAPLLELRLHVLDVLLHAAVLLLPRDLALLLEVLPLLLAALQVRVQLLEPRADFLPHHPGLLILHRRHFRALLRGELRLVRGLTHIRLLQLLLRRGDFRFRLLDFGIEGLDAALALLLPLLRHLVDALLRGLVLPLALAHPLRVALLLVILHLLEVRRQLGFLLL